MASAAPSEIVDSILSAITESGGTGIYVSDKLQTRPRVFGVRHENRDYRLWVYIWTLTHGGRDRLPHEYRIQMTSVDSPLEENPDGPTLLMGYHPETGMLAGFDVVRHRTFTTGSPSVQIDFRTVETAIEEGMGFDTKANEEIAIGVRPDHFLVYAQHALTLHQHGADMMVKLQAAIQEETAEPETEVEIGRQRVVQEVSRLSRDANFRSRVVDAYNHRCAVTGRQLGLVDAAHILPVAAGGLDEVSNGICLSPTMHRALDNSLIYLDHSNLTVQINSNKVRKLQKSYRSDGIEHLNSYRGETIHLPEDRSLHPDPAYIRRANEQRRVG